ADRWWLASDDRRFIGGSDGRSQIPVGGQVSAVPVNRGGTGTLPGTGGATVLKIPVNSSGSNLSVADFVAAGAPTDADRYDSGKVLNARNAFFRINGSASAEYAWRDWMAFNASGTFSRVRSYGYSGPLQLTTSTNPTR